MMAHSLNHANKPLLWKADGGYVAGAAYLGSPARIVPEGVSYKPCPHPIGWAKKGDANFFAHEVGHLFGASHNREIKNGGREG